MRSSTVLAVLFAGLAFASPIVKKDEVTDIVTVVDYVYVTDVVEPPQPQPTSSCSSSTSVFYGHHSRHHRFSTTDQPEQSSSSTTSPAPPPPPASTTTSQVPLPVVKTQSSSTAPPVVEIVASPSPVQASSAAPSPTDLASSSTYHHNIHRQNHSAVDVAWDAELAADALTLANTCNFHHDISIGKGGYGQNIYEYMVSAGGSSLTDVELLTMAISDWYNSEYACFLPYFGKASPDMSTFETWGHITQILWNSSTTIGCAAANCPNMNAGWESWFVVCNYGPAGNVDTEYAANVFKGQGGAVVNG